MRWICEKQNNNIITVIKDNSKRINVQNKQTINCHLLISKHLIKPITTENVKWLLSYQHRDVSWMGAAIFTSQFCCTLHFVFAVVANVYACIDVKLKVDIYITSDHAKQENKTICPKWMIILWQSYRCPASTIGFHNTTFTDWFVEEIVGRAYNLSSYLWLKTF